jgi:hypothetical protein
MISRTFQQLEENLINTKLALAQAESEKVLLACLSSSCASALMHFQEVLGSKIQELQEALAKAKSDSAAALAEAKKQQAVLEQVCRFDTAIPSATAQLQQYLQRHLRLWSPLSRTNYVSPSHALSATCRDEAKARRGRLRAFISPCESRRSAGRAQEVNSNRCLRMEGQAKGEIRIAFVLALVL